MPVERQIAGWITQKHVDDYNFQGHSIEDLLEEVGCDVNYETGVTQNGEELHDIEVWYYPLGKVRHILVVSSIVVHLRSMGWTEVDVGTPTIDGWQQIKPIKLLSPKASKGPFSQLPGA